MVVFLRQALSVIEKHVGLIIRKIENRKPDPRIV